MSSPVANQTRDAKRMRLDFTRPPLSEAMEINSDRQVFIPSSAPSTFNARTFRQPTPQSAPQLRNFRHARSSLHVRFAPESARIMELSSTIPRDTLADVVETLRLTLDQMALNRDQDRSPTYMDTIPRIRVELPMYCGSADARSPSDFLEALAKYQLASNLTDDAVLLRVVPLALTGPADQWLKFVGQFSSLQQIKTAFQNEFQATDYLDRLRSE